MFQNCNKLISLVCSNNASFEKPGNISNTCAKASRSVPSMGSSGTSEDGAFAISLVAAVTCVSAATSDATLLVETTDSLINALHLGVAYTKSSFTRPGVVASPLCPLCGVREDTEHVLRK